MTILSIHNEDPGTDVDTQHPTAQRYQVGPYFVDAIGEPTLEAVLALMEPLWRTPLMADLRVRRDKLLEVISGIQADALTDGDQELAAEIKVIKGQLRDLPALPQITEATDADALKAAALASYRAISELAPQAVKLAIAKHAL